MSNLELFLLILGVTSLVAVIVVILQMSILSEEETQGGIVATLRALWRTFFGNDGRVLPSDPDANREIPLIDPKDEQDTESTE